MGTSGRVGDPRGLQGLQGDGSVGDPMGTSGTPGRCQSWGPHGDIGDLRGCQGGLGTLWGHWGHQEAQGDVSVGDPMGTSGTPGDMGDPGGAGPQQGHLQVTPQEGGTPPGRGLRVAWGHWGHRRGRDVSFTPHPDVARPDKISGADINSICQEVGDTGTWGTSGTQGDIGDTGGTRPTTAG